MARNLRATFLYVVFSIFFCAFLSHHYLHRDPAVVSLPNITTATALNFDVDDDQNDDHPRRPPPTNSPPVPPITTATITSTAIINHAIHDNLSAAHHPKIPPQPSPLLLLLSTVSLLLPDWEVLVIVSPEHTPTLMTHPRGYRHDDGQYLCSFPNSDISPATPAGVLHFPDRATFKCVLPERSRRRLPFPRPVLTKNRAPPPQRSSPAPEMLRWTYVAYDSLTTEDDVVVFAKGLNHRQGINREPSEFKCVFYRGDDVANGVRTAVTNSMQEVFRCQRPSELNASFPLFSSSSSSSRSPPPAGEDPERIKVTLETVLDKRVLPSVAYYNPPRKLAAKSSGRALLCACTMVYNVAKFLKEWVVYHSKIGVQRFLLYDNGSDDNLKDVVEELVRQGYDVNSYFWYWPKAQEAGFSHSAVYAKDSCTWTAYIDVDEFIYSPSWFNSSSPSSSMLHSLLTLPPPVGAATDDHDHNHNNNNNNNNKRSILTSNAEELASLSLGQVHIGCHEFGPSNRTEHPAEGVMQGYNCRKQLENRHKSIVLLDAVDNSLLNVIHHFSLKPGYCPRKLSIREALVNHYKFQAWPEFKTKFRRRVSAYVVDWTQQVNPGSNDRTPGLGFSAVEPQGWPGKFCEVLDNGLKDLTRKWFALEVASSSEVHNNYKMAWQR
ncbi:glycosyltransferase family 92 protein Os08g0121900-like [Coffea arabica]|uniref:Glycosyltransferase family 92 protein Os08g0121900-like n=1 Tax=Coffea arabica TaxID=13443 RepID=A0ABM4VYA3_COFAR